MEILRDKNDPEFKLSCDFKTVKGYFSEWNTFLYEITESDLDSDYIKAYFGYCLELEQTENLDELLMVVNRNADIYHDGSEFYIEKVDKEVRK